MILDSMRSKDVETFRGDLKLLISMTLEMDSEFGGHSEYFTRNKPLFDRFTRQFSSKYHTLIAEPVFNRADGNLLIFFKEGSIMGVYDKVISKIEGLSGVGGSYDRIIMTRDASRIRAELAYLLKKAYFTFMDRQSVIIRYSKERSMVQLVFDPRKIMSATSPTFKLCCYYAITGGYDRDIDLKQESQGFSYSLKGVSRSGLGPRR